ncbi:MAG: extracellular solute-binding protein, partial [Acutalibacteraceae bacterium]
KGQEVRQEAEFTFEKNSRVIYPTYDRSSASTLPSDPYSIKLNTIGQSSWNTIGDTVTWEVDVKTAGWYELYFRARQNYKSNANSYRRLMINGVVPFKEADCISFAYKNGWYIKSLGDTEPLAVYLKPGDKITMECVSGPECEIIRNINRIILDMNAVYRKIIVITGSTPDLYRDYRLEVQIPNLLDLLQNILDTLNQTVAQMAKINEGDPNISTLKMSIELLEDFIDLPYSITERLSLFKENIESMGSLLMSIGEQPLELDCFWFVPEGEGEPDDSAGFIKSCSFQVRKFIASFIGEYDTIENMSDDDVLSVWVSTGRDQMKLIDTMIQDSYTANGGAPVKLSLVDTGGTLIQATLAGKGPDVALIIPTATPINLAMRGALVDLSDPAFGLDEIMDRFYPETWTPYRYNGGIYAIPETQVFDVMFYRTDILRELNITPPKTWDEFYETLRILQKNNLEFGILEIDSANPGVSAGLTSFNRFLLQRGGTYYNEEQTKSLFDTDQAYEAFEEWVYLYKKYGLERSFDMFNRFRTGEMPMCIAGYTFYNQLMAAAPEIRGLWSFALVPGTRLEDGTVDHSENASGTACIMLQSARKKGLEQKAFDFMKWWTGADAQTR